MYVVGQSNLLGEYQPAYTEPQEKTLAMASHLLPVVFLIVPIVPFGSVLAPLILWMVKKDTSPAAAAEAKEALNFQLTMAIAIALLIFFGFLLLIVIIGFFLLLLAMLVGVYALVLGIVAGLKANEGHSFKYPFTLRLIK